MASHLTITGSDTALSKAREAEVAGNLENAAELYEQAIKENANEEFPFDRLMIIYRKLKQSRQELRVINKGIRAFEQRYKKPKGKKSAKQQKLSTLSEAFMKSTGLKDKKGTIQYMPEPLLRWTKRKSIVESKLK
ncbi:MAG: hypothetical protein H7122_12400 [Chitinophagaceae bacterium]|nr:hypothetical protein [Chitinophagaceae bacterium]